MDITYTVDGVDLDDAQQRWVLDKDNPHQATPDVRSAAIAVPGRHGFIPAGGDVYGAGTLGLRLNVTDIDSAGVRQGLVSEDAGHAQLRANQELLFGIMYKRHDLLTIRRRVNGVWRRARGRVITSTRPVEVDTYTSQVTVVFELPDPFWYDDTETTFTTASLTAGVETAVESTTLGGGNAPIRPMLIMAPGPLTSLEVRDANTDRWVKLSISVLSDEAALIDTETMQAWITPDTDQWDSAAGVEVTGALDSGIGAFSLEPTYDIPEGQTVVNLLCTRAGAGGTVSIRTRRAWLQ